MKREELISCLKDKAVEVKTEPGGEVYAKVRKEDIISLIEDLHLKGLDYLATITCLDLGDDERCELIYNLFDLDEKVRLFLACELNYETDKQPTVMHIWPHARYYEREIYEMFGLHFSGNPDYTRPFIFEGNDPVHPKFPMRKSFDTVKFSLENYGERDYGGKKTG